MYYPEEVIEEVRVENDILDIISEYVTLKKKGSSFFGLCPFHNEKTPSFSVSQEKQLYYCFGCGVGGNVINFIMEKENYGFIEAVQLLASKKNISLPQANYSQEDKKRIKERQLLLEMHTDVARYFYYNLQKQEGKEAKDYLDKRKLDPKIQRKFGLGYAKASHYDLYNYLRSKNYSEEIILESGLVIKSKTGPGCYDRFSDRLMFPIFDAHGRVIAFGGRVLDGSLPKYLNSPETKLFEKNSTLYGLNYARVSGKDEIFIVEGYMDVMAMYQAGIRNVVATLGTAFTKGHAKLIKRYTDEVILLYDSDDAGIRAALRSIPILQDYGIKVRVLQLPNRQDPDDYILDKGVDSLKELATNAHGAVMFQTKIIKGKYNIENVEDKIKFIDEVSTLLAKLNNAVEQEVYIQETSKEYRIEVDALKTEVRKKMKDIDNKKRFSSHNEIRDRERQYKKSKTNNIYFKTQTELLQIMCMYPEALKKVKEHLKPSDFIDPFFQKLVDLIYRKEVDGNIKNPSKLSNYFDKVEDQNKLANIFLGQKSYESEEMIIKVINDTVKKLKIKSIENELKETTDIKKLQNLLKAKKEIDKLYIDCIYG